MEEAVRHWLSLATAGYLPDDVNRNVPLRWRAVSCCWCESILKHLSFSIYKNSDYCFPLFVRCPRHFVYLLVSVDGANGVAISLDIRCGVWCVAPCRRGKIALTFWRTSCLLRRRQFFYYCIDICCSQFSDVFVVSVIRRFVPATAVRRCICAVSILPLASNVWTHIKS
jgi:hypothetical protein